MDKKNIYRFADQYTKYPGGRFRRLGKYSGEDFRETVLRPIFESGQSIEIDAAGVLTSFSPSFLDECFGQLAVEYGLESFRNTVKFYASDNPSLKDKMMLYVNKAIRDKN